MNVLVWTFGRNGDVILASSVINSLQKSGHVVTAVTIPAYLELLQATTVSSVERKTIQAPSGSRWEEKSTEQMKKLFPGYDDYLNLQIGAEENHNNYRDSKMQPFEWLAFKYSRIIKDVGFYDGLFLQQALVRTFSLKQEHDERKRALIIPNAITCPTFSRYKNLLQYVLKSLNESYDVLVIDKEKEKTFSFVDLIGLIKSVDLFIGPNSGPAWAAFYSNCQKRIYHDSNLKDADTVIFSKMDLTYEDIWVK